MIGDIVMKIMIVVKGRNRHESKVNLLLVSLKEIHGLIVMHKETARRTDFVFVFEIQCGNRYGNSPSTLRQPTINSTLVNFFSPSFASSY